MPIVDFDELDSAVDFTSDTFSDTRAWVSRETGEIIYDFDEEVTGMEEEFPDDIDDEEKYVAVPDRIELDLGKHVVMDFVAEKLPDRDDEVREIFRRRGAYSRFKDMLEHIGMLDAWYRYEKDTRLEVLTEWARDFGFEVGAKPRPAPE